MIDFVDRGDELADERPVGDVAADQRQPLVPAHGREIPLRTGRLIIHHRDAPPFGQEQLGEMAADETSPAGDEHMLRGSRGRHVVNRQS